MNIAWTICRASGLAAWLVFTVVMALGLLTSSGLLPLVKVRKQAALKVFHEQLTWTGLMLIAVHIAALACDEFVKPTLKQIAWPFSLDLPAHFWIGLGMIAAVGFLVAVVAALLRTRMRRQWRWAHRISMVAYLLLVAHVIGSGTDTGHGAGLVLAVNVAVIALTFIGLRVYGARLKAAK